MRTRSNWLTSAALTAAGSTVIRSLLPFPARTVISIAFHIDIFDPEAQAFTEAQAGPVKQHRQQQPRHAVQGREQRADFGVTEDHRQPAGTPRPHDPVDPTRVLSEHGATQEQHGGQGLIL